MIERSRKAMRIAQLSLWRASWWHTWLPSIDVSVAARLPDPPTVVNILTLLLESERCAIRSWIAICDMTFGKDPRTYDLASRILNEEIEHEAWFIELLAHERDGKTVPSGHFRRGEPGHAPYSKNASFYNP